MLIKNVKKLAPAAPIGLYHNANNSKHHLYKGNPLESLEMNAGQAQDYEAQIFSGLKKSIPSLNENNRLQINSSNPRLDEKDQLSFKCSVKISQKEFKFELSG